jgi:hypothetical protein
LSVSSDNGIGWIFRIFDRRTILVKAKNEQVQKIAVVDLSTNLPFSIDISKNVSIKIEKTYFASLKVYTARNVSGVSTDALEFFEVLDVDQSIEDFIKMYWLYPKLIKFELVEAEPL